MTSQQTAELAALLTIDPDLANIPQAPPDIFGSPFRVTDAAVISVGVALATVAELHAARTGRAATAHFDDRHAAAAFHSERLLRLLDHPQTADLWDPVAGNYRTQDGWIRLHTNLTAHREATLTVLGVQPQRQDVAAAVATWRGDELEAAVIAAGGVAATMRTRADYLHHPQRAAVIQHPVIDIATHKGPTRRLPDGDALDHIRVLDLSRVIAGPVAGRFLASFGADVIRVDPPFDDGLLTEIDTSFGKRRTTIDLRDERDRRRLDQLVADADIVLDAFRPGALAAIGYPDERLRQLAPDLIIGHLSAYGEDGPWGGRRGFDSVVQVATGLAHACGFDPVAGPSQLPAQALDHATGYLLAAGLTAGLIRRQRDRQPSTITVSLARTAEWLAALGQQEKPTSALPRFFIADLLNVWTDTSWGSIEHLRPVGRVGDRTASWARPPSPRNTADIGWLPNP